MSLQADSQSGLLDIPSNTIWPPAPKWTHSFCKYKRLLIADEKMIRFIVNILFCFVLKTSHAIRSFPMLQTGEAFNTCQFISQMSSCLYRCDRYYSIELIVSLYRQRVPQIGLLCRQDAD